MAGNDLATAGADAPGRKNELFFLDRKHIAAHDTGGLHPVRNADNEHNQYEDAKVLAKLVSDWIAEQDHDQKKQRQLRDRQEQIGQSHEHTVESPEETSNDTNGGAQDDLEQHGS